MPSPTFDAAAVAAISRIASARGWEPEALLAICEVEANGKVFAMVRGKPEPYIRWEGHYFDRRLKNGKQARARAAGLAHPKAGAVKNPGSQEKRWDMVRRASAIDDQAAKESFSIGIGQVMTAHWKALKFTSVDDMIRVARIDAAGQVDLMARYIHEFGLADELKRHDWAGFARGYNGPAYKKNAYHRKMATAYARLKKGGVAPSPATGMLRMGATGAKVRELQALLTRAGFPVKVDGDYGPATKKKVAEFQKHAKLEVDGVAGPQTLRALDRYKTAPDEAPGETPFTEVKETREAAKGIGLVALVTSARDQIAETATYLTGIEADAAQTVANLLLAGSGAIGVGLAAYALWGWVRSKRTDEGDIEAVDELRDGAPADDGVLA